MKRLLVAGILYLIVISIVLAIKPGLMFTEDGNWKEFGIGRNTNTYTWMPFWLFSILTALVSYILVTLGFSLANNTQNVIENVVEVNAEDFDLTPAPKPKRARAKGVPMNLPDGYYMLNREATEAAGGIPKYIYLGKDLE
jgi:hypothetical protein